jgi:competence ComEA-like helix-hairpin-helix protein
LKVDINTADVEELDELPEVGPATAETIVEYRRTNGMFRSVDELASVRNCKNTRDHVPRPADRERLGGRAGAALAVMRSSSAYGTACKTCSPRFAAGIAADLRAGCIEHRSGAIFDTIRCFG